MFTCLPSVLFVLFVPFAPGTYATEQLDTYAISNRGMQPHGTTKGTVVFVAFVALVAFAVRFGAPAPSNVPSSSAVSCMHTAQCYLPVVGRIVIRRWMRRRPCGGRTFQRLHNGDLARILMYTGLFGRRSG